MNKRKIINIVSLLLIAAIAFSACSCEETGKGLTEEEGALIRQEHGYPIYKERDDTEIAYSKTSFREIVTYTDTFAYCEVIKETYKQEVIMDGNVKNPPMLDVYTVRVIEDTEGLFEKNTVLTYSYGLFNEHNCPKPLVGDKIILALTINPGTAECVSGKNGFYYVYDGYGIAAFEEEEEFTYTGKTVNNIMKALKKTDAEEKEYWNLIKMRFERSGGKDGYESIEMLKEQIKEKFANKDN